MCSAHKTVPIMGNISEAAIIHVCLLLSEASLPVAVTGHTNSHLCTFTEVPSFPESRLPFALQHRQVFLPILQGAGMSYICHKPPLLQQHPSRTRSGQDHDSASPCMPPASYRRACRLSELSAKREGRCLLLCHLHIKQL